MSGETTWPLFWCLRPEAQVKFALYAWDNFGIKLVLPPSSTVKSGGDFDNVEALTNYQAYIDRFMRQIPKGYHHA